MEEFEPDEHITNILSDVQHAVPGAAERLLPIVYDELRGIAGRIFKSRQMNENSIQPTILVHDVFMKLAQITNIDWKNRSHFYAVAARATRNLLVDHAREQLTAKRGGGWNRITLDGGRACQKRFVLAGGRKIARFGLAVRERPRAVIWALSQIAIREWIIFLAIPQYA